MQLPFRLNFHTFASKSKSHLTSILRLHSHPLPHPYPYPISFVTHWSTYFRCWRYWLLLNAFPIAFPPTSPILFANRLYQRTKWHKSPHYPPPFKITPLLQLNQYSIICNIPHNCINLSMLPYLQLHSTICQVQHCIHIHAHIHSMLIFLLIYSLTWAAEDIDCCSVHPLLLLHPCL